MSCSDRRTLLAGLAVMPLAACGFKPLYGKGSAAEISIGRVRVEQIGGLMGFKLRQRLTSRLGAADAPSHRLNVDISTTSQELAINPQSEITRYSLTGIATYRLTSISDDRGVLSGNVRAFAAYSATASAYATTVAERDARERLANSLAEQIATRLAASADRWTV